MGKSIRKLKRLLKVIRHRNSVTIEAKISFFNGSRYLIDFDEMHAWLSTKRITVEEIEDDKVIITMPKWYFKKHFENRYDNRDKSW